MCADFKSIIYRRLVDFQVLDKDIITGDFQFVRDFTPGIFVANTGSSILNRVK